MLSLLAGAAQPNVVLILADDLGYEDTSLYMETDIVTPSLDRLATQGVTFTEGYSAAPLCGPARAALMTGKYPQSFGYEFNPAEPAQAHIERRGLPEDEITLAEALSDYGYDTALIGKWHLGSATGQYPTDQGFKNFYGIISGATPYADKTLPWMVSLEPPPFELISGRKLYNKVAGSRDAFGEVVHGPDHKVVNNFDEYLTEDLTDIAIRYITERSVEPFFLYLSYTAPHLPLQAPQDDVDAFAHIADPERKVYLGMVKSLDDQIGRVLDTLDVEGLTDNTIIIFSSDNGSAIWTDANQCNYIRGSKGAHMETGIRVPTIISWPGEFAPGSTYYYPISHLDIFPTILEEVGGTPNVDGVNILPYVQSDTGIQRDLYWKNADQITVRNGDYKLRRIDGVDILHDLSVDRKEEVDLAVVDPITTGIMSSSLDSWLSTLPPPSWPPRFYDEMEVCGGDIVPIDP
jgi:arylsulfatase A-like enzyme